MRDMIAAGVKVQMCVTSPPYWGLRDYGVEGQLGLESTPDEYVSNMVEVFRLVRELLADDGTLWLNLGDSYAGDTKGDSRSRESKLAASKLNLHRDKAQAQSQHDIIGIRRVEHGLKPKDLVGIPWRVAFALQADGWYLRSDIIWAKPNPMPESVTDRPTKAHEYLFLLAKRERYFYDADAIREADAGTDHSRAIIDGQPSLEPSNGLRSPHKGIRTVDGRNGTGRNRRTVWTVATEPYSEAHFATFPRALIEPCILAGTSQKGHCPGCGKGWVRMLQKPDGSDRPKRQTDANKEANSQPFGSGIRSAGSVYQDWKNANPDITTGWQPSCTCNLEPVPGIVFDPFLGSGTTAQVAQDLGRRWLGCELNAQYGTLQTRRTEQLGMALA